jgi:hypothetical protein
MSHQKDVYYALHDAPVVYSGYTQKVISKTDYINLSTIFIAINVRNFNSKADFRENATSFEYKTLNLLIITVIQDMKFSFFQEINADSHRLHSRN